MDSHLLLPIAFPLCGAVIATLAARRHAIIQWSSGLCVLLALAYALWLLLLLPESGRQILQTGSLGAPYGIPLVADRLSAVLLLLAALVTLAALLLSFASLDRQRENFFFYPLLLLLLLGVNGAVLSGDIFNLYIWFEVLLAASFGLLILGGKRGQLEGGLKYILLNMLGSAALLLGCGLSYGLAGSLNMAQLSARFALLPNAGLLLVLPGLLLVAFGMRAALFPFFFWLPASAHTPPVAVSVMLGALLTRVGIYALYRTFPLIYPRELAQLAPLLLLLATLTMAVGIIGAMGQTNLRRMLSFLVISQSGYLLLGLGLAGTAADGIGALAAGMVFLAHDALVMAALLCVGGVAEYISRTGEIRQMGGLARREPLLALLWFLAFLSLVGVPPLGGFFARLALLQAALMRDYYAVVAVVTLVSLLYLVPLLRVWHEVFWKNLPENTPLPRRASIGQHVPAVLLVGTLLLFALLIEPVVDYCELAAQQVFDSTGYQADVLVSGSEPLPGTVPTPIAPPLP
jgi:multicomponent Na+:H+ antiporter subunit D